VTLKYQYSNRFGELPDAHFLGMELN